MLRDQEKSIIGTLRILSQFSEDQYDEIYNHPGALRADDRLSDRLLAVSRILRDLAGYLEEPCEEEAQDIEIELSAYAKHWAAEREQHD